MRRPAPRVRAVGSTRLHAGHDGRSAERPERHTVEGLAAKSGNPRFAWDSYRRFITMFGDVVLGIHYTRFAR